MDQVKMAAQAIRMADGLLIGASNGLSIAEGYNIFANNEMFKREFGYLERRYGIRCVLDGIFYNYPSKDARDEFFNVLIQDWIEDYAPGAVMRNLRSIVGQKDYFIVTSNGDMHLEKSGFDPERIFEIEGTFITAAKNLPIQDRTAQLHEFIGRHRENLVFLELGIGSRNRLIKEPMLNLARQRPRVRYVMMNLTHELLVPEDMQDKVTPLAGDLDHTLALLSRQLNSTKNITLEV